MPRYTAVLLALATLSAPLGVAYAQETNGTSPANSPATSSFTQSQPAPIERGTSSAATGTFRGASPGATPLNRVTTSRPAKGVYVRASEAGSVTTVSSNTHRVELRVERGVANISVHDPDADTLVLVDLPAGQTQILRNGLYTFNATTGTARVFQGEADAFPGTVNKPTHLKDGQQVAFSGGTAEVADFDPAEARADLLPGTYPRHPESGYAGYGGYGYGGYFGPYGDGFYPYAYGPYYAWGGPWWGGPWGYPYGLYGGPWAFGLGFGFGYGFGGYGVFHRPWYGVHGGEGFHGGEGLRVGGASYGGSSFHGGGGFRGGRR